MNKTRAVLGFVVVLTAAAYLAGYWPERQRRVALEAEVAILRPQLVEAQAKARLAVLLPNPRKFGRLPNSPYLAARSQVILGRMNAADIP